MIFSDTTNEHNVILIAEDDDVSYLLFEKLFKNYNVVLKRARNGSDVIEEVYNNDNINLVLMDIRMPKLNGFEATQIIKSTKPHLPIIAQSACVINSDLEKIKTTQFDGFIAKPIIKDKLFDLINRFTPLQKNAS